MRVVSRSTVNYNTKGSPATCKVTKHWITIRNEGGITKYCKLHYKRLPGNWVTKYRKIQLWSNVHADFQWLAGPPCEHSVRLFWSLLEFLLRKHLLGEHMSEDILGVELWPYLYFAVLLYYYTIQYYHTTLQYTTLHFTIPFYTLLYYTIVHCPILY